jgi:Fe-S cluster assembly ATP-binding protein
MGRNGSGKSTLLNAIMGRPGLEVTGTVRFLDIPNLLDLPVHERARAGVFLSMQAPPELAGVGNARLLQEGLTASGHAVELPKLLATVNQHSQELGLPDRWAMRALNVGASGGERKKNELLHLQVMNPKLCLLDELEAGLDRDAVDLVGTILEKLTQDSSRSWLMVSHTPDRLKINPTHVHVIDRGRLVRSGGAELAQKIQKDGYETLV